MTRKEGDEICSLSLLCCRQAIKVPTVCCASSGDCCCVGVVQRCVGDTCGEVLCNRG